MIERCGAGSVEWLEDDPYTLESLTPEDVSACLGFLRRMTPPAGCVYVGRATRELAQLREGWSYTDRPQLSITARFDDEPDIGYCYGIGRDLATVRGADALVISVARAKLRECVEKNREVRAEMSAPLRRGKARAESHPLFDAIPTGGEPGSR